MTVPVVLLGILNLEVVKAEGLGLELPYIFRFLIDFAIVNGDVVLFTNFGLSLLSLYSALGLDAQRVLELNGGAQDVTSFEPSQTVAIVRVLETWAVSTSVVVASLCMAPVYVYSITVCTAFASLLPLHVSDGGSRFIFAAFESICAPFCPLAMIWPWKKGCGHESFLWFHGTRCSVMWLFWAWVAAEGKTALYESAIFNHDQQQQSGIALFLTVSKLSLVGAGALASIVIAPLAVTCYLSTRHDGNFISPDLCIVGSVGQRKRWPADADVEEELEALASGAVSD